ncbi:MAG: M48 family metallopeptidase [Candidatus Paceibacteria bacterium]
MFWLIRKGVRRKKSPSKVYLTHRETARFVITNRVNYFAELHNFEYGRIAIKDQKKCWGSCSTKKNLNFNYKLLFLPPELLDYIVVHELCHLRHFHHQPTFWAEVRKIIPDYKIRIQELRAIERDYGSSALRLAKLKSVSMV